MSTHKKACVYAIHPPTEPEQPWEVHTPEGCDQDIKAGFGYWQHAHVAWCPKAPPGMFTAGMHKIMKTGGHRDREARCVYCQCTEADLVAERARRESISIEDWIEADRDL